MFCGEQNLPLHLNIGICLFIPLLEKSSFAVELGHGLLNCISIWIFIERNDPFIWRWIELIQIEFCMCCLMMKTWVK